MQYTGHIVLVQDLPAAVEYAKMGFKICSMSEDYVDSISYMVGGVITASILLPPCDAMTALLDNNFEMFKHMYMTYLSTDEECLVFQDILVLSSLKGINIVIYVEKNELELGFFNVFTEYMANFRGLCIGNAMLNIPYSFIDRPEFHLYNLVRFYYNDFITVEEFMALYPYTIMTDMNLGYKVCIDLYGFSNMPSEFNKECMDHINKRLASRVVGVPFKKEGFIKLC